MRAEEPTAWVVYTINALGKMPSINAICTQGEWSALDLSRPGRLTLVREQIDNEGEAERLARSLGPQAPPKAPRPARLPLRIPPVIVEAIIGAIDPPVPDSQNAGS